MKIVTALFFTFSVSLMLNGKQVSADTSLNKVLEMAFSEVDRTEDKVKLDTRLAICDLSTLQTDMKTHLQDRLLRSCMTHILLIHDTINMMLEDLHYNVNNAKRAGKDAEHCFTEANATITEISKQNATAIYQCYLDARKTLEPHLDRAENLIESSEGILSKIKSMYWSCHPILLIFVTEKECRQNVLKDLSDTLDKIRADAVQLKITVDSGKKDSEDQAVKCYQNFMNDIFTKVETVKNTANECVEKA